MERLRDGFGEVGGIAGVGVWVPRGEMRVTVGDGAMAGYSADEEATWAGLCAANPRVHDGEILAVRAVDFDAGVVRCERERYKRLAVQWSKKDPAPLAERAERVRILGVKGFVTARDADDREHLLIGRRGTQTRVYGGLWESAPAGGVGVPPAGVTERSVRDLAASVEEEGEEELGLRLDVNAANVVAVCRDYVAGSDDVFLSMRMPGVIDPRRSASCRHAAGGWEYSDTAWLAREDAAAFDGRAIPTMIAPVRAVLRVVGWI